MGFVNVSSWFYFDSLTIIMLGLVAFISCVIWVNSKTYMHGDRYRDKFLSRIILLGLAISCMVAADNILIFCGGLITGNLILIQLILHKKEWAAAKASAVLASKYLLIAFGFIAAGFYILISTTNTYTIQGIIHTAPNNAITTIALGIIFIGIMLQSALWPFHKWLISSLNSPTPVSALMHAGIINGGGFLLIRFAPLYMSNELLLNIIFIVGLISAFMGTLFKLLQNDYKRMLACSTMGQMGFMIMQCGLGLYSAAIAHLCWHGIFKAFLFLLSGSAAQDGTKITTKNTLSNFMLAILVGGVFGTYVFCKTTGHATFSLDNTMFLNGIVFITLTQFAITILSTEHFNRLIVATLSSIVAALIYASSVKLFEKILISVNMNSVQHLNFIHGLGFLALLLGWICVTFRAHFINFDKLSHLMNKIYVLLLNACQPDSSTVTPIRNLYNY